MPIAAPPILACPAPIVHDGDTLHCPSGHALRLARIDAPEMAGSPKCRSAPDRPICDHAAAVRSRDNLRRLVAGGPLRCRIVDASPAWRGFQASDRYGRPVVRCTVNGRDLGAQQLAGGFAVRWPPAR